MSLGTELVNRLTATGLHVAAQAVQCPHCQARPGTACQVSPAGQHVARYSRAYKDHRLTAGEATAVFDAAQVIANWAVVPITDIAHSATNAGRA